MSTRYALFSADDHIDFHFLPGDLWQNRVPKEYEDRAPRLIGTSEGSQWVSDGVPVGAGPSRTNSAMWQFGKAFTPVEHEAGRWRPTTPELRLEDMDRDGVEGQVLYGANQEVPPTGARTSSSLHARI